MVLSNQIAPGMTLSVGGKLYRVESSVKVTVTKGTPFIKTKLRELATNAVSEKNFKLNQSIQDVTLNEKKLEYLYMEGKDYLFIDIATLDQVLIPAQAIGNRSQYLKEGEEVKASFYGKNAFAVELPQFLELMVARVEGAEEGVKKKNASAATRVALLESGARIEVPPFIEVGDIIKVDTITDEYVQRV